MDKVLKIEQKQGRFLFCFLVGVINVADTLYLVDINSHVAIKP